jgi:hypothetical protein
MMKPADLGHHDDPIQLTTPDRVGAAHRFLEGKEKGRGFAQINLGEIKER